MRETRKNDWRRIYQPEYNALFKGRGIDIGCGGSPVFDDIEKCMPWDLKQGDATFLEGIPDNEFDWVHSSHCLEHLEFHEVALDNWWRVLRNRGYLIVTVPCYFLYEKKQWPSKFNTDHKQRFSLLKTPHTIDVLSLFSRLKDCQIRWARTNDLMFDYAETKKDQTATGAQSEIEIVARKLKGFWTED